MDKMDLLKKIKINLFYDPIFSANMIPGTENKLMLSFSDSQFVYLCNVETGLKQILIQGSPNSNKYNNYPCFFFLKSGDGYELHFCIVKQEKGTTVHSWYRWFLDQDFFSTLNTYGKLPLEMDVKKLMDTIKDREDFKQQRDDSNKKIDEYKQQIDDYNKKIDGDKQ